MSEVIEHLARTVLSELQETSTTWRSLLVTHKIQVEALLHDLGRLAVLQVAGQDVAGEVAICRSTALDWAWVGASVVRSDVTRAVHGLAQRALEVFAELLSVALWTALASVIKEALA